MRPLRVNKDMPISDCLVFELPPELEERCEGEIVAASETGLAYFVTSLATYAMHYHDSTNQRLLLRGNEVVGEFTSTVCLTRCAPRLQRILEVFRSAPFSMPLERYAYLSRIEGVPYIGSKKEVDAFLTAHSITSCPLSLDPMAEAEVPLARFDMYFVARALGHQFGAITTVCDEESKQIVMRGATFEVGRIIASCTELLTGASENLLIYVLPLFVSHIEDSRLTAEERISINLTTRMPKISYTATIRLSPRQVLGQILLGEFAELIGVERTAPLPSIPTSLGVLLERLHLLHLPQEIYFAYAQHSNNISLITPQSRGPTVSLLYHLLRPQALHSDEYTPVSSCWIDPDLPLGVDTRIILISRQGLSSDPLQRAFWLFDRSPRWDVDGFSAMLADACRPEELDETVERCSRRLGTTSAGAGAVVGERREKRVLLLPRTATGK
ncbi:hypothetical protein GMRT_14856 [Giardia muris]|uniref:Uncharacterized protein n=1 Tax=Giardia muris TaxID=5742 RepID=A0A4Z1SWY7_GIAMU|nr:hypothetical protein GMRT_14856 [Giardia muris]|eukprot:TNJ26233.1 hypothetical protein GMRT_14856 [Giardia muris]